jgi:sugar-phosphatase
VPAPAPAVRGATDAAVPAGRARAPGAASGFDAAIFDMDGLLVDSEPLWHEAEIAVLGALGVPLAPAGCRETKGMFVNEVARHWFDRYPWSGPSTDEVAHEVVDTVMALVVQKGRLQPGVEMAIGLCRRRSLPLAIASSSEYRLIDAVLGHFGLTAEFDLVHSAEDEQFGKPHPAVFLTAARRLGVRASSCVVWEDSPAGVLAAKAAQMACVAVPEPAERARPEILLADIVLDSLVQADDQMWDRLEATRREHLPGGTAPTATD